MQITGTIILWAIFGLCTYINNWPGCAFSYYRKYPRPDESPSVNVLFFNIMALLLGGWMIDANYNNLRLLINVLIPWTIFTFINVVTIIHIENQAYQHRTKKGS